MAFNARQERPGFRVPEPDGAVPGRAGDEPGLGGNGHGFHLRGMTLEAAAFAGANVPESQGEIVATRNGPPTRNVGHGFHRRGMPFEPADLARVEFPEPHRIVEAGRQGCRSVGHDIGPHDRTAMAPKRLEPRALGEYWFRGGCGECYENEKPASHRHATRPVPSGHRADAPRPSPRVP